MNYRKILKAYMDLVSSEEGVDFLPDDPEEDNPRLTKLGLTKEEIIALYDVSDELMKDTDARLGIKSYKHGH